MPIHKEGKKRGEGRGGRGIFVGQMGRRWGERRDDGRGAERASLSMLTLLYLRV